MIHQEAYKEAKPRIPSQRDRILFALRDAGEEGITNLRLSAISPSWWARLQELSMHGYKVDVTQVQHGIYKYVLTEEPKVVWAKPPAAISVLLDEISKRTDGKVSGEELSEMLKQLGFTVKRKQGFYKEILETA